MWSSQVIDIQAYFSIAKHLSVEKAMVTIGPGVVYLVIPGSGIGDAYVPLSPAFARDMGDALVRAADALLDPDANP